MKRTLLWGAGAIGGTLGAYLARAGRDVTLVDTVAEHVEAIAHSVAYLAARQPAEAAGEFQRIVDQPGIVLMDPMGATARLQLARALVLTGDIRNAKIAYDDLFEMWQNADPDIPVLKEARAESARMP